MRTKRVKKKQKKTVFDDLPILVSISAASRDFSLPFQLLVFYVALFRSKLILKSDYVQILTFCFCFLLLTFVFKTFTLALCCEQKLRASSLEIFSTDALLVEKKENSELCSPICFVRWCVCVFFFCSLKFFKINHVTFLLNTKTQQPIKNSLFYCSSIIVVKQKSKSCCCHGYFL